MRKEKTGLGYCLGLLNPCDFVPVRRDAVVYALFWGRVVVYISCWHYLFTYFRVEVTKPSRPFWVQHLVQYSGYYGYVV
jgi:hypothetical protein